MEADDSQRLTGEAKGFTAVSGTKETLLHKETETWHKHAERLPRRTHHTQQPPWSNENGEVWTRPTCTSRSCPPSSKELVVEAA